MMPHAILELSSVWQFITVLLIFVFVLFITAVTTKWIGNYQKEKTLGDTIKIVETKRIAPNKYLEIIQTNNRYFLIAIGKDTVTTISELSAEDITLKDEVESFSFKDFFNKAKEDGKKE